MVETAERVAPLFGVANAEFRVLDAERIELPDASIDGVLSRFGYVLKGDPPPALREVRRVLRPGGGFAFAVWAAIAASIRRVRRRSQRVSTSRDSPSPTISPAFDSPRPPLG